MKTSDWIALLSTAVSTVAIIVSARIALIAVRIQAKQSDLDREQARNATDSDLADVARNLANRLSQLGSLPFGPESAAAQAEVMGLVLTANKLSTEGQGNWYLYYGLAQAYSGMGEYDKARTMWDRALAKTDSNNTRLTVLSGKGMFYYTLGPDGVRVGRQCFDQIEQIIRESYPAEESKHRLAGFSVTRAYSENLVGNFDEAANSYTEAWLTAKEISIPWRREQASDYVANTLIRANEFVPIPPEALPPDLKEYTNQLWQRQNEQALQQQVVFTQQVPYPTEDRKRGDEAQKGRRSSVSRRSGTR